MLGLILVLLYTDTGTASVKARPYESTSGKAPYLYYYADTLSAFVIERADGTDSRTLGAGLIPPPTNHYTVDGAGWSPSGKWFAFSSSSNPRLGVSKGDPSLVASGYIIRADGEKVISLGQGAVIQMAWSPVEDLLFVAYSEAWGDDYHNHFALFNAEEGKIILTLPTHWNTNWEWSSDGKYIALYYAQDETAKVNYFVTITRQGKVSSPRELGFLWTDKFWSPDGWLAHIKPDKQTLLLENPATGKHFEVPNENLYWSPAGHYALLWSDALRLISLDDQVVTTIAAQEVKSIALQY
jgi:hypothetical protein